MDTIIDKIVEKYTNYDISKLSGGSIQITSAYKGKIINYKLILFFGYCKSKNPITATINIDKKDMPKLLEALDSKLSNIETIEDKLELDSLLLSYEHSTKSSNVLVEGNKVYIEDSKPEEDEESSKCNMTPIFIDNWNKLADMCELSKISTFSSKRKKHFATRMKECLFSDNLNQIFTNIANSKFLTGDNDRGWKIDVDWLIANDSNYIKVLEGKYK